MIYFLQDPGDNSIKIGYTGADTPDSRLKACQTGNPRPLDLLGTMHGDESVERSLHVRFASDRMHGEWFRPTYRILSFIIKSQMPVAVAKVNPWPLTIYLAGKISKEDWREKICGPTLTVNAGDDLGDTSWPIMSGAILDLHHYAGPYFAEDVGHDSWGWHGDDQHGIAAGGVNTQYDFVADEDKDDFFAIEDEPDGVLPAHNSILVPKSSLPRAPIVHDLCAKAIQSSDLVFAWIDSPDCYGTIAEIGYAAALGKTIWIAGPRRYRDLWFVYQYAHKLSLSHWIKHPKDIFTSWMMQVPNPSPSTSTW